MSLLHPILCLKGKRKEIFDLVFSKTCSFEDDKIRVANILLNYDEDKLEELFEIVKNSNNKMEEVLNKGKNVKYKKAEIPKHISL